MISTEAQLDSLAACGSLFDPCAELIRQLTQLPIVVSFDDKLL